MRALNGNSPLTFGRSSAGGSICRTDSGHCGELKAAKAARQAQSGQSEYNDAEQRRIARDEAAQREARERLAPRRLLYDPWARWL